MFNRTYTLVPGQGKCITWFDLLAFRLKVSWFGLEVGMLLTVGFFIWFVPEMLHFNAEHPLPKGPMFGLLLLLIAGVIFGTGGAVKLIGHCILRARGHTIDERIDWPD